MYVLFIIQLQSADKENTSGVFREKLHVSKRF